MQENSPQINSNRHKITSLLTRTLMVNYSTSNWVHALEATFTAMFPSKKNQPKFIQFYMKFFTIFCPIIPISYRIRLRIISKYHHEMYILQYFRCSCNTINNGQILKLCVHRIIYLYQFAYNSTVCIMYYGNRKVSFISKY